MAFSNTIQAHLSLGISKFTAGLRAAKDQAGDFSKTVGKKFSMGDAGRSMVAAFGLSLEGIAEKIANYITKPTQKAIEQLKALQTAQQRLTSANDERLMSNMDDEEKLAFYRETARLARARAASAADEAASTAATAEALEAENKAADLNFSLIKKAAAERKKAADDEMRARKELNAVEQDLSTARIEAAREAATLEDRVHIAALEVADAQEAVAAAKAGTVEHARAELELLQRQKGLQDATAAREREVTEQKEKQLAIEDALAQRRTAALAQLNAAISAQQKAQAAYAAALSDQSAASLDEITGGTRGSRADQLKAAEVARLRSQAAAARDADSRVLVGGQAVSVADQLSSRANQLQSTIGALNSSERDPLAGVTEQLKQANDELGLIRESLALIELEG